VRDTAGEIDRYSNRAGEKEAEGDNMQRTL
jgi:hypothetical protein